MKFIIGALLCVSSAMSAYAQVAEVRAGAAIHDLGWSIVNADGDEEKSFAFNAEIIFEEPKFLKWALSPQPYIGGTFNVEGKTNYGGAGLLWRKNLNKKIYSDFALGLVIHDGTLDLEDSLAQSRAEGSTTPIADAFSRNFYGSRILFRPQLTLGVNFSEEWAVEGFVEHISHAGLLSDGPNEGSDAAGFRINRKF